VTRVGRSMTERADHTHYHLCVQNRRGRLTSASELQRERRTVCVYIMIQFFILVLR
jgi:hypothetical protein